MSDYRVLRQRQWPVGNEEKEPPTFVLPNAGLALATHRMCVMAHYQIRSICTCRLYYSVGLKHNSELLDRQIDLPLSRRF